MDRSKRGKPQVQEEEGVKEGNNREDDPRQDKRPKPVGRPRERSTRP